MSSAGHARHYLSGLLGTQRRKNIEAIGEDVKGSDYQGMEQFVSSSPWDHSEVMEQVAADADALLGDSEMAGLFIDESSFAKKGRCSVGVQRQWSGRAGKVENCQVGVYACLGKGDRVCLTDFRLFLPESWAQDSARLDKAKVPEGSRDYLSKHDQALEMIEGAREAGLRFGWVGFDSLYGSSRKLVNAVEDMGLRFVGDVGRTTKAWTSEPSLVEPSAEREGRGRRPINFRLAGDNRAEYLSVEEIVAGSFDSSCRKVCYRKGAKGELWTEAWVREVWAWEPGPERARQRLLIVRRESDGAYKCSLSNLPVGKTLEYYAWAQGQRFWIEHAFREAKSQLGMAQYQVRVWRGWHHHMALVSMALLFSQNMRIENEDTIPLLSVRDITELLDFYLPRKRIDEDEVRATMRKRHERRQRDIDRRERHRTGLISI